jgi:hypothetical protein
MARSCGNKASPISWDSCSRSVLRQRSKPVAATFIEASAYPSRRAAVSAGPDGPDRDPGPPLRSDRSHGMASSHSLYPSKLTEPPRRGRDRLEAAGINYCASLGEFSSNCNLIVRSDAVDGRERERVRHRKFHCRANSEFRSRSLRTRRGRGAGARSALESGRGGRLASCRRRVWRWSRECRGDWVGQRGGPRMTCPNCCDASVRSSCGIAKPSGRGADLSRPA